MTIFIVFVVVSLISAGLSIAYAGYNTAQRGNKRDMTTTPAFVHVPQSHYYLSRSKPVTLICGAENVCDVQIKCGEEKFQEGGTRVCGKKCKGCKRRAKKLKINFDDIPKKTRYIFCRCKVWGTIAKTSGKSKVEKAFLRRRFGTVPPYCVAPVNSSIILSCNPPSGSPKPRIKWLKNGQQILPRDLDMRMRANITKDLVINRAAENDSGEYQCVAENIAARREGPVLKLCVKLCNYYDNISNPVCQESKPEVNCSRFIDRNKQRHDGGCDSKSFVLVVGTQDGLFTLNPQNTTNVRKIHSKISVAVDFGVDTRSLYWSDTKGINCFSLNNGLNKDEPFRHDDVSSIEGIAVDWVGDKLYWVDSKDNTIFIGDLQNGRQVALLNVDIDAPRAILVSPSKGYMYWTDWGRNPKIERARLDGTDRKVLIDSDIQFPNGLAYDEAENTLYWTDGAYGTIEAVSSDGSNRTLVFNGSYHPFGLDVYKDFIYWTDWKVNSVLRIHKSGLGGVETMFSGLNQPMGIKILHSRKPIGVLDLCSKNNGGCQFLCLNLPSSRRQKCFCGHGYELSRGGKNCDPVPDPGATKEKFFNTISLTFPSWAVILLIIVCLLVVFGFVFKAIQNGCLRRSSRRAQTSRKKDQDERDIPLTDQTEFTCNGSQVNESANLAQEESVTSLKNDHVEASARNGIVVHMTKVEVAQNGGVTVVGDGANIHYPKEV